MLGSEQLVAFLPTTDLDRARAFYEGTLGLSLVEQTPFACVFDAAGTTLRVTLVERTAGARYTVAGWSVADIAATIEALTRRGVAFERYDGVEQDERGVWRSPGGALVAWFRDPDANTLSLTQG
jgi:catechol 2,3-dioxygenase-like lactoylglutathione lyase family enzyme